MNIITIEKMEDFRTLNWLYRIRLFDYWYFIRTVTAEQIFAAKKPLWLRSAQWLLQKTCKHDYKKYGSARMEGYFLGDKPSTMIQELKCRICDKTKTYKYRSGVDTSF